MKFETLRNKFVEVTGRKFIGVKKEEMIAELEAKGFVIEGESFANKNVSNEEFKSVSAQIRWLFDEGNKQSEIAKLLGVRDQMVSNVVRKYKQDRKAREEGSGVEAAEAAEAAEYVEADSAGEGMQS